jgi:predicted HAD superfamily Cof-like phosphohydrolase
MNELDEVEILDAGVDILYIVLGTMHEAGVLDKFSQAWDLVHFNNMTKLDEHGKVHKNENGKVIKPANYKPVNLNQLF